MERTLKALIEPHRREIVDLLRERPHTVGELIGAVGISQPRTSKHLAVLREAGLVHVRRDAQRRIYALRPEPLAELDAWLQPYRRFWAQRLDALDTEVRRGRTRRTT